MQKYRFIWKSFVFINISLSIATSPAAAQSNKIVRVFFLGGQSNMVGTDKAAKLRSPYNEPFSKVKIWNPKKKEWMALSPEVVNVKGRFGPEISFGHAIAEAFPDEDIRLVKYAVGGTALYNDWDPKTKGKQYEAFMKTTGSALAELDASKTKYEIAGMLWLQGESDAHENKAETYEKNLTEFIAHMRKEFKTPAMPFLIARVRDYYGGESGQAKIVRDAQVKVANADKNTGWFDTDDCSMINEGHYDAAGLIDIGRRFAAEYMNIVPNAKKVDLGIKGGLR